MQLLRFINKIIKKIQVQKLNKNWHNLDYIVSNLNKLTLEYKNQHSNVQEIEHQAGRFLNMKKIVKEINELDLKGDLVEFGTWQGLGLILFKKLFGDRKMNYFGIDSFEGLPHDSHFWKAGMFDDTSSNLVSNKIDKYTKSRNQFHLIKGWFSDKKVSQELYNSTKDIILVHFDADLGSSTTEALQIIEPFLINRNKPIYFLFDDWGCHPDEVPDAFFNWVQKKQSIFNFKPVKLSSTRFTRYYRLDF